MAVLHKETLHLAQNGSRLTAHVVRPESQEPLPGVVLIQEWWGIEPHVLDLAQRLAAEGFVVLVPDLYHGKIVTEPDEAGKAVMMLHEQLERALGEIRLALDTLKARPDVEPKRVGIVGFCVGGLLTWLTTLRSPDLAAAVLVGGAERARAGRCGAESAEGNCRKAQGCCRQKKFPHALSPFHVRMSVDGGQRRNRAKAPVKSAIHVLVLFLWRAILSP
jgi:dienelactone hydrolase